MDDDYTESTTAMPSASSADDLLWLLASTAPAPTLSGFEGVAVPARPPDLSIGSLLSSAWDTLKRNWGLVGVMVLGVLAMAVSFGLLAPAAVVAMNAAALRAVRGQSYDLGEVFQLGFNRYVPMLLLLLAVVGLSFVLALIPILGSIVSFLLGLVFSFVPFVVVDGETNLSNIMARTRALLEPHLAQIVLVMLVSYIISFALTITIIGILIAAPLLNLVYAEAYDRMRRSVDAAASQARMAITE